MIPVPIAAAPSAPSLAVSPQAANDAAKIAANRANSSFHAAVGSDGVLMISLERASNRYNYSANQLKTIGIFPSILPATDGSCASLEALAKGCAAQGGADQFLKAGQGCAGPAEQAIADSHRRALEIANARREEWTAIFEDDAVPVLIPGMDWDAEFKQAWAKIPPTAKMARLSWCAPHHVKTVQANPSGDRFQWVEIPFRQLRGCTTAYMVHKSIIPEMLKLFPCYCAVDCCYLLDFFQKIDPKLLVNLVARGGDEYIKAHQKPGSHQHRGVLMQARDELGSTRT
jgi:hypothetical protein